MYRDPNAGQNYNMTIGKGGRVQHLETALTIQNPLKKELRED
jgi:hypothetical protein